MEYSKPYSEEVRSKLRKGVVKMANNGLPAGEEPMTREAILGGINTLSDDALALGYAQHKQIAIERQRLNESQELLLERLKFLRNVFATLCSRYEGTDKYVAFSADRRWLSGFELLLNTQVDQFDPDVELAKLLGSSRTAEGHSQE